MNIVFLLLSAFVVFGTFIPMLRLSHWTVRGWDFPRLQLYVVGQVALAGLLWPMRGWSPFVLGVMAVLVAALVTLAAWMWRYTPLSPKQVKDSERSKSPLRLLVSNVLMTNRDSGKLISAVREKQPDIIVALETDQWWADQLSALSESHPHVVNVPQDDTYGMIVRSRLALIDPTIEHLVNKEIPSVHFDIELVDGTIVKVHALHPKPPFPDEDEDSSDRDAELMVVAKRVKAHGQPCIVLGDMNDVAWSHTTSLFQKVSGLLDLRIGRGFFSTFNADHWWMRWPLDHVFVSDHFRVQSIERLDSVGSDHFPMYAALSFEPEGRGAQYSPTATDEERREANEKIKEGG